MLRTASASTSGFDRSTDRPAATQDATKSSDRPRTVRLPMRRLARPTKLRMQSRSRARSQRKSLDRRKVPRLEEDDGCEAHPHRRDRDCHLFTRSSYDAQHTAAQIVQIDGSPIWACHIELWHGHWMRPFAGRPHALSGVVRPQIVDQVPSRLARQLPPKPGIAMLPSGASMPCEIYQNSSPSLCDQKCSAVKSAGGVGSALAAGPSPRPSAP